MLENYDETKDGDLVREEPDSHDLPPEWFMKVIDTSKIWVLQIFYVSYVIHLLILLCTLFWETILSTLLDFNLFMFSLFIPLNYFLPLGWSEQAYLEWAVQGDWLIRCSDTGSGCPRPHGNKVQTHWEIHENRETS